VTQWFEELKPEQGLVMMDACRSELRAGGRAIGGGDAAAGMAASLSGLQAQMPRGLVIVSATEKGQRSHEWAAKKHGVFTVALLEALRGGADANGDQTITLEELMANLQAQTPKMTAAANLPEQRPTVTLKDVTDVRGFAVASWRKK
jgi:uncharacterized caspase-like protein